MSNIFGSGSKPAKQGSVLALLEEAARADKEGLTPQVDDLVLRKRPLDKSYAPADVVVKPNAIKPKESKPSVVFQASSNIVGGVVALPPGVQDFLKKQLAVMEQVASNDKPNVIYMSTEGHEFSVPEKPDLGRHKELSGTLVHISLNRGYYPKPWSPGSKDKPVCSSEGFIKLPASPTHFTERQAEECAKCPKNVFGSASTGDGKACREYAQVYFVPVGMLGGDPLKTAIYAVKIPLGSIKFMNEYILNLARNAKPMQAVVTKLYIGPSSGGKSTYSIRFQDIGEVPPEHLVGICSISEMLQGMTGGDNTREGEVSGEALDADDIPF